MLFRKRRAASTTTTNREGLAEARRRYGGLDLPAALAGMVAALGTAVVLAGIAGAIGTIGYQRGTDDSTLTNGGLLAGLAVLVLAFLTGGWVAGRMSRYDGVLNGTLSAALFLLLAGGLSVLGRQADAKYDFFGDVNLPSWFSDASQNEAIGWTAVGIVAVLVAAALGGAIGSGYHRRADRVVARTLVTDRTTDRDELVRGDADVDLSGSDRDASHSRMDQSDYEGRHSVR